MEGGRQQGGPLFLSPLPPLSPSRFTVSFGSPEGIILACCFVRAGQPVCAAHPREPGFNGSWICICARRRTFQTFKLCRPLCAEVACQCCLGHTHHAHRRLRGVEPGRYRFFQRSDIPRRALDDFRSCRFFVLVHLCSADQIANVRYRFRFRTVPTMLQAEPTTKSPRIRPRKNGNARRYIAIPP